ncbi:MAG: sulfite exporter TauE/SafE family protein [Acidimicrobiales bacterium]|nr:sulfite exporter TauE/SafE family protein [Acidimicrobiales bacterium]HRW38331.1 sulfite exporter TauE/SafE family protein [Aquihabitans sp.]
MSGAEVALVVVAALACGAVNALAGGGSLILFPALVATGMGTLAANVTNSVSTWPGYLGSIGGFRAELAAHRHRLPRLAAATVAGSLVGCALLLATPTEAFDAIVPILVLVAAGLLAVQPAVARRVGVPVDHHRRASRGQLVAISFAAVYGGYFGAALGVIFLGVLALTIDAPLRELNGLKAGLSAVDATVSLVVFGLFGPVAWGAVAVAAPATLVGGYLGARVARRVPDAVLRPAVIAFAVLVALALAVR